MLTVASVVPTTQLHTQELCHTIFASSVTCVAGAIFETGM